MTLEQKEEQLAYRVNEAVRCERVTSRRGSFQHRYAEKLVHGRGDDDVRCGKDPPVFLLGLEEAPVQYVLLVDRGS